MKIPTVCLLLIFAAVAVCASALPVSNEPAAAVLPISSDSLVRVNSTNQAFDFFRPWTKKAPYLRRGLGVVLAGGQVLVTAELVANRTYVELEKAASAEKSPADVIVADYDCNLALIRPTNSDFLKDAKPIQLDSGARVLSPPLPLTLGEEAAI